MIMEEIIADDSDEDKNEDMKANEKKQDVFTPTQPLLLSQKAELLEQSQRDKMDVDQYSENCSIEDILGDKLHSESPDQKLSSKQNGKLKLGDSKTKDPPVS